VQPQITITDFLDNINDWVELSFIYKAIGNENYIFFGNFDNDANTVVKTLKRNSNRDGSYIYLDDVSVTPYNCFVSLAKDTTICNNDTLRIQLNNPVATYTWQDGTIGPAYTITQAGKYWVTTTAAGCTRVDTINVHVKTAPAFSLGVDKTICKNEYLQLQAPANYQYYQWQDTTIAQSIVVKQAGLYWLQAGNNTCSFRDSINIFIEDCACMPLLPSAFSPNGDNVNDGYAPIIRCALVSYDFNIFNRYGQAVFKSNDPLLRWAGTFLNKPCPTGTYVYELRYQFVNGIKRTLKGSILLMK
jgi:gliding motility-associated-like protein